METTHPSFPALSSLQTKNSRPKSSMNVYPCLRHLRLIKRWPSLQEGRCPTNKSEILCTVQKTRCTNRAAGEKIGENFPYGFVMLGTVSMYQRPRLASSASSARSFRNSKKACDWPMKSPMSVRNFTTPFAIPFVSVGRMIEHGGSLRLRNGHGSGMIRLV